MPKKKKIDPDTLVAASGIAIEGKHFNRGDPVEGVSDEQIKVATRARRVVTAAELMDRAEPGESEADEASTDEQAEA